MSNRSLRRAAILIASLDTESADALLDEMSPDQAALVRNAVMQLGDIDIVEQQEVIEQFVGRNSRTDLTVPEGVEVDSELERKFSGTTAHETEATIASHTAPEHSPQRPFAFLDDVDASELGRVLANEHPQTTAIVIAHLEPERAANVLARLPRERKADALMRIARLTSPHPEIIRDLEQEMRALLANRQRHEQIGAAGLATVEEILKNSSTTECQSLVADLSRRDQILAGCLQSAITSQNRVDPAAALTTGAATAGHADDSHRARPDQFIQAKASHFRPENRVAPSQETVEFADLERLPNTALAQILHRCSPNTTLLALAGASHQFVRRVMAQLPGREAAQLERKIEQIGPLRLDDVQRAQQELAGAAQQLSDEGCLTLPKKQRLSVAA